MIRGVSFSSGLFFLFGYFYPIVVENVYCMAIRGCKYQHISKDQVSRTLTHLHRAYA